MRTQNPKLPYYAVIFSSVRTEIDEGYSEMAEKMEKLAKQQDGFLGIESVRDGLGITISYWRDLEAIKNWKNNLEHSLARKLGREKWYESFKVRIVRVEHEYEFKKE